MSDRLTRSRFFRPATPLLIGLVAILAHVSPACAGIGTDDPASLVLGVGGFDVIDGRDAEPLFRGEYRFGSTLFGIRPLIGVEGTSKGTVYGYGGINLDITLVRRFVLTPNFAIGAWGRSNGTNLGNTVEFRTGVDLAYRFNDHSRLGVSFAHISNAGLSRKNPGEEEAVAFYALPLGLLFP